MGGSQFYPTIEGIVEVYERFAALRVSLSEEESLAATEQVRGHKLVEVLERSGPEALDSSPEALTLPEPRPMGDYIRAPCKHECIIISQVRHAKEACGDLKARNQVKQALMRATASQCGMDSAKCHALTVTEVAELDRPGLGNYRETSEATFLCGVPPPFQIALR
jgi:hypothetical protein